MPGSIRVGSLLGIPFYINVSWLAVFALVTFYLASEWFPMAHPRWPLELHLLSATVTSLLFFVSIVLHELAHSVVALRLGLPVRSITLFILGGVAQIAREAPHPSGELAMAAAGPLASFALSAFFAAIWAATREVGDPVQSIAAWLAIQNLILAIFNMLPGFPMDGGRVLRALLWWATGSGRRATAIAVALGRTMAVAFIAGGITILVLNRNGAFLGAQIAMVGWFLHVAASGSVRQVRLRDALASYTAGDLMSTGPLSVPMETPVQQVVAEYLTPEALQRGMAVVAGTELRGLVSLHDLNRVPKHQRPSVQVRYAMTPVSQLAMVHPLTPALTVLEEMDARNVNELPVVSGGVLQGIVTRLHLLRPLETKRRFTW